MKLPVYYSPEYVGAKHTFDTTRKAAWIAKALDLRSDVELRAPTAADRDRAIELMGWVHDPGYIAALETGHPEHLAESQGFDWDPGLWRAIVAQSAGVLAATDAALDTGWAGSLSSGLHHAKYASGDGFCSVNGLVMAAWHAQRRGVSQTVILDFDAHAGGGTYSLLPGVNARHVDLTVAMFDTYTTRYRPFNDINITLTNPTDRDYLGAVDFALRSLDTDPDDTLVIYNAGMDPYNDVSRDALCRREERVVRALESRGLRSLFVLAGGYTWNQTRDQLRDLHLLTVDAYAGAVVRGSAPTALVG